MHVRDHQLDAPEAAPGQRAQKLGPERLGLGGADCDAQHLASAIAVDGDGDDHRDRDDATGGANLEVGRIQPEIGPVAFQRPVKERGDLVVDLGAQAAHLALGDAKASQTSRFGMLNGFASATELLPLPVGSGSQLNNAAPSIQPHYRTFRSTTSCSAPVPRIGTLILAVLAAGMSPFASGRQVLTFHTRA
jgi:hypothetical protein